MENTLTYDGDFDLVIKKSHDFPVVIQFYADWCGPCRTLKPVLQQLADDNQSSWLLAMVDVEKHPQVAALYEVRSIPQVHLLHRGASVASFTGARPKYIIENWLDGNLPKDESSIPVDRDLAEVESSLKKGNVDGATHRLLDMLEREIPDSPLVKLLNALRATGRKNAKARQVLDQVDRKGVFGSIAKRIRDLIDMDENEKDVHTPGSSPYRPAVNSTNQRIDIHNFDAHLLAQLVHDGVNEVRQGKGASSLREDSILLAAATDQNIYQLKHDVLSHYQENPNKKTVKERVDTFGGTYSTVGENVQYQGMMVRQWSDGRKEIMTDSYNNMADTIVQNWVNSPGHYRNMINQDFTRSGTAIGWNPENNSIFATQVFAG